MSPVTPSHAATDRNLLFGILAQQLGFISRDVFHQAMHAWASDKQKSLSDILCALGAISPERRALVEALVIEQLPQPGTVSLGCPSLAVVTDPDVQASLNQLTAHASGADPWATQPAQGALPTGAGSGPGAASQGCLQPGGFSSGQRFRILRPHAKGGLGKVSVAHDEELHREVALKEILARYADDPASRARFLREAEITGSLEHPGIVPVYGLGTSPEGRPFYAMRFIRGDSLQDAIDRFHRLGPSSRDPGERAVEFRQLLGRFVDVCQAVAFAHSRGVLHRDLKPGNIMLGRYGETLVVDGGLARLIGQGSKEESTALPSNGDSSATRAGQIVGTPAYMSPEQAKGQFDLLGSASDVYGLGAVLYALLTGRPPVSGNDTEDVLRRVRQGDWPRPRQVNPAMPRSLEAVCLKALARQPEDRYTSALELAGEVERWLADEPVAAYREPVLVRTMRWARRHRTLMASLAAGVLVALAASGAGAWWLHREHAEAEVRRQEADQKARLVLDEAQQRLQWAWREQNLAGLNEARVAAERAGEIAHGGTPQVEQEAAALQELARERIRRTELNQVLRTALLDISAPRETRIYERGEGGRILVLAQPSVDEQFSHAFRRWGMSAGPVVRDELLKRLADQPPVVVQDVIAGLDAWAIAKRLGGRPETDWRPLLEIGGQLDLNDRRRQTRELLTNSPLRRTPEDAPRWDASRAQLIEVTDQVRVKKLPVLDALAAAGLLHFFGEDRKAEELLRATLAVHPEEVGLLHALGRLLEAQKPPRTGEAIECYRAARALHPELGIALAKALADAKRRTEAELILQDLRSRQPENAEIYFFLGMVLREENRLDEAVSANRRAVELNPGFAEAYSNLGAALSDQQHLEDAVAAYQQAIALRPDLMIAHYNLGIALRGLNRPEEAAAAFRRVIELKPDFVEGYFNLAAAQFEQKKLDESAASYRRVIELKPDDALAYNNLGKVLLDLKKPQEAETAFRKAIALQPDYALAYSNLGVALHDQKKLDEAVGSFRKAIELDPTPADAYLSLGITLCEQQKHQEAVSAYEKAIALKPDSAEAYYNLGVVLDAQKKLVEAVAVYRKVIGIKPDYARAYYNLGVDLAEQKQLDAAVVAYRRFLELQPGFAQAYNNLGDIFVQQKRLEQAVAAFRKAEELLRGNPIIHENLQRTERWLVLDRRLPGVLSGREKLPSARERLELGVFCAEYKRYYAGAAALHAAAFAADPRLADDLNSATRYKAACYAVLASEGQGEDAGKLSARDKSKLRHQALDWLRADVVLWSRQLAGSNPDERAQARTQLRHWLEDAELSAVRGKSLSRLPDPEREAWTGFWMEVKDLLARAGER